MGATQVIRLLTDLSMITLMPLLMAYSLVGETAHEWLGIAMAVLFIFHHLLNLSWYRRLFWGRYTAFRIVLTVVNTLLLADFLLLFYSGIDLSRHLMPFLPEMASASLSRMLHLSGSHWGLVLMSVHLGLHMSRFSVLFQMKRWVWAIPICIAAFYGGFAFIEMNFTSYLLPTSSFLFFDASQSLFGLVTKTVSVMVLFVLLGYIIARLTKIK